MFVKKGSSTAALQYLLTDWRGPVSQMLMDIRRMACGDFLNQGSVLTTPLSCCEIDRGSIEVNLAWEGGFQVSVKAKLISLRLR